jgi:hypothetical protein
MMVMGWQCMRQKLLWELSLNKYYCFVVYKVLIIGTHIFKYPYLLLGDLIP